MHNYTAKALIYRKRKKQILSYKEKFKKMLLKSQHVMCNSCAYVFLITAVNIYTRTKTLTQGLRFVVSNSVLNYFRLASTGFYRI